MFSLSEAHLITDPVLRDQIEQHPRAQDLLRAFLYPYAAPDHDFLFRGGEVTALSASDLAQLTRGRTPVLAVGSNRAPIQLTRKFTHQSLSDEIPVTHGWISHHDIVYSTHLTGYGAVPATLAPSPGTRVRVSITWLTATQLAHMHVTESVPAHYSFVQLHGRDLELDCGLKPDHIGMYQSVRGHVFDQGAVYALSAIEAKDRRFASLSQWDMIAHFAKRAGHSFTPGFVLRVIDDVAFRRSVVERG
ncbi:hypothetical protein HED22_18530 [Thalassospira sp. HF15]|uniref:hypothetical protein n=1 Tax=Thalassospira sp. HF15 TaxID=2722755 RepID=UPI001431448A|nr:hypothetical protein [Thalassospira sp. HF15]NIY77654.1 hypothetical protein [Thalassospira sp. HF15]